MPRAGSKEAPHFEDGEDLESYLSELEQCFREAGIQADAEKVDQALRYLKPKPKDVWRAVLRRLTVPPGDSRWERFKAALYEEYLEANPKTRYRLNDLANLVDKTSRLSPFTKNDFENYSREFNTIADSLMEQGIYSESEARREYLKGLPKEFREQMVNRLSIVCLDHHPDEGYDRDLARKHGRHLLDVPTGYTAPSYASVASPATVAAPALAGASEAFVRMVANTGWIPTEALREQRTFL